MKRSPIIVFSGLDGAGKTTQINLLLEHLRAEGQRPVYLWVRGGYTPLFVKLKALLRRAPGRAVLPPPGQSTERKQALGKRWVRRLWLTVSLLDLMLTYGVLVRWWRVRGRTVVCDRYLWDTELDFRLNFPQEQVETWWLSRLLTKIVPRPAVAFLLLLPVEESLRRSKLKKEPFPDTPEVLAARLAFYQNASAHWDCQMLDGRRTIAELAAEIQERVAAVMSRAPHSYTPGAAENSASIRG